MDAEKPCIEGGHGDEDPRHHGRPKESGEPSGRDVHKFRRHKGTPKAQRQQTVVRRRRGRPVAGFAFRRNDSRRRELLFNQVTNVIAREPAVQPGAGQGSDLVETPMAIGGEGDRVEELRYLQDRMAASHQIRRVLEP